jgi:hypothetical protein
MGSTEFQLLMIFWNLGLVDTFSVVKLCVNCGSQYLGIILSSAAGNSSDLGMTSLLEPILRSWNKLSVCSGSCYCC